ncbi:MAG: FecR domain-containing protein [Opitutaceae bacterium]|nr:FecR domain-containing protein [Opitutaceae bacterium]
MSKVGKDIAEDIADIAAQWLFRRNAGFSAAEQSELETWKAADPLHASAFADLERDWSILDRPLKHGRAQAMLAQLVKRARHRRLRRMAWTTAACFTLLGTGVLWRTAIAPPQSDNPQRVAIVVPDTRTLPDGSIVELKSGAQIRVDFSGATRAVALISGEAHFQVAHDAKPFVVTAGAVEFRAVGTAFSVELAAESVALLVTQGRVAVEKSVPASASRVPSGTPEPAERLATVDAGNRVVVPADAPAGLHSLAPVSVPREEMSEQMAWRIPRIDFTRIPLAEAIDLMNQRNPGQLQMAIDDKALGSLRVSGLFRADRVDAFVGLLETNFGVEAETRENTIHLRKRR